MLTENDKQILEAMDAYTIGKLKSDVEGLIAQADKILKAFPDVSFDNAYDTAFFQSDAIMASKSEWNMQVLNAFDNLCGENFLSARQAFNYADVTASDSISTYGDIKNIIQKKYDILVGFLADISQSK